MSVQMPAKQWAHIPCNSTAISPAVSAVSLVGNGVQQMSDGCGWCVVPCQIAVSYMSLDVTIVGSAVR